MSRFSWDRGSDDGGGVRAVVGLFRGISFLDSASDRNLPGVFAG